MAFPQKKGDGGSTNTGNPVSNHPPNKTLGSHAKDTAKYGGHDQAPTGSPKPNVMPSE